MRRRIRPILLCAVLLSAACATPAPEAAPPAGPEPAPAPERACTLIGCANGWSVQIDGRASLPDTYTIRVLVDGAVVASATCSPTQQCGDQVFLAGVTAEEAQLEILGSDTPLRWTVRPEYNVVQPNGPDCEPTCRQARVVVRSGG